MNYSDEELIPISALQHFIFCPRQCALIHIERVWKENLFTTEGKQIHEKVHDSGEENRPGIKIERGKPIRSLELGITGQTDAVEYHSDKTIIPIEYKRGKPKSDSCDEVQLCAQAICLEEMLSTQIEYGYLFYARPRRRTKVVFGTELRQLTVNTVQNLRKMIQSGITPEPVWKKKRCNSCSLNEFCHPERMSKRFSINTYLQQNIAEDAEDKE